MRRSLGKRVVAMLTSALLAGCGGAAVSPAPDEQAVFWAPIMIYGLEVEHYATLAEMAASADLVARGRVTDYGFSRTIGPDPAEGAVANAVMSFSVTEVLRGDGSQVVPIEFILHVRGNDVDATIARQAAHLPGGEFIAFLREKELGLYRLVNSFGMWTVVNGAAAAPVALDPAEVSSRYGYEVAGVDSLAELAELVGG